MSNNQFGHIEIDEDETPRQGSSTEINERSRSNWDNRNNSEEKSWSTKKCIAIILLILIGGLLYFSKSSEAINSGSQTEVKTQTEETSVIIISTEDVHQSSLSKQKQSEKTVQQSPKDKQDPLKAKSEFKLKWPEDKPDYNVKDEFNLWDMPAQEKKRILKSFKNLPQIERPAMSGEFLQINYDNDDEFLPFASTFQSDLQVVNWSAISLSDAQKKQMQKFHRSMLQKRKQLIDGLLTKYKQEYLGKDGFLNPQKEITYQVFLDSLETQKLTGQDFKNKEEFKVIYQREREYHQKKYRTNQTARQIHACVVAPTYNNNKDYRYAWHIESLFQQDYKNYRVIIIDDFSTDGTGDKIAKYLSWRQLPSDKFILLKNKVHRTALQNIYYATNKYCDLNQIAFIVDGDDELVGTQVFKMYNMLYQRQKMYVLYSNFISYDSYYPNNPLTIGISEKYPFKIIESVQYRTYSHSYSHLRTMMTDLFFFEKAESLKDENGKFYWTLYDNAIYYPALEMSCGRVTYVPELKYWYTANTGINDWRTPRKDEYKGVAKHISKKQKRYHCINNVFEVIIAVLQESLKH